jgi:hypothetical protein
MSGAYENAFHIPRSAFFKQRATDVLPDIVADKDKGNPIPAAEIGKRNTDLVPGAEGKHISPVRGKVKISLTIPVLRIA